MDKPYTGGCACGAIRYEITSDPVFQNHCQCRQCQMKSGTGHASFLSFVGRSDIDLTGHATVWTETGDGGTVKSHGFCPVCGTQVWLTLSTMADLFAVTAASLDEPERFAPQVVTYGSRGYSWDHLDPALTVFERMPAG
jgi:hypothetical protein